MSSERIEPPIVDMVPAPMANLAQSTPASSHEPAGMASALHPLSLVFELAHRVRTNLIPAIFASFSAATGGIVGLYIGLGIFGIAIVLAIIRFMTFRYRLTDDHLMVDQGLLFRTHRSVPIDRIQNIDSVQNLFHRFFKVAEVRIETASGNEPEAIMRVISLEEVERLRSQLSRLSSSRAGLNSTGVSPAESGQDTRNSQATTVETATTGIPVSTSETVLKIRFLS